MNASMRSILLALGLSTLSLSCAQEKQVEYANDATTVTATPAPALRRSFRWEGQLSGPQQLTLANAQAFTMTLSGCASTQTATVTETSVYLELYEFDRNCVVKLTQFTLNSKVYTPKAGSLFTTWAVGDKAVFTAGSGDDLGVEVITTITNPVTAGGTIKYQFSEITKGSDTTIGEAVVRQSQVLTVNGQAAPDFSIGQIKLVGITASGNAEFQFQLQCNQDVVGSGSGMECFDVSMTDIYLVLTEDTYSGTLTQTDLDNIYTAESGGKQVNTTTEVFTPGGGTPAMAHGGFITAAHGDANVMVMSGTKPIDAHPHMLLILKAGPSYLYFNVDVTTITQSGDAP